MGLSTPSTGGGAPKDAEYVTGSSDSELSNETVVSPAGDILTSGSFGTTTARSPGFDTFVTLDANNPGLAVIAATAESDGSTSGSVDLFVDESGGTTRDYFLPIVRAKAALGSSRAVSDALLAYIPAGAQYQISNSFDPNNNNAIDTVRELVITP